MSEIRYSNHRIVTEKTMINAHQERWTAKIYSGDKDILVYNTDWADGHIEHMSAKSSDEGIIAFAKKKVDNRFARPIYSSLE